MKNKGVREGGRRWALTRSVKLWKAVDFHNGDGEAQSGALEGQ